MGPLMSILPEPSRAAWNEHRNRRVLIVEDDPSSRWVLSALMKRWGYECEVASNGEEGLRKVQSFQPRMILMDLMMPVVDGIEAIRRLKSSAPTRDIPVLALSGNRTANGELAARDAGCDDFLAKPIVFQDLLERVESYLKD